jgi:hypothetical protein
MSNLNTRAERLARLAQLQALESELRAEQRDAAARRAAAIARSAAARETLQRAKRSRGFIILPMLALLALGAAAVYAGHTAELRQREALALHCARASDGADSSIADCYASRDLPLPEGI